MIDHETDLSERAGRELCRKNGLDPNVWPIWVGTYVHAKQMLRMAWFELSLAVRASFWRKRR